MNNSRLWLLFSTVVSIGMGFAGGLMVRRKPTNKSDDADPIGRLYEIDGETYVDGGLIEFLTPRANSHETLQCSPHLPCPGDWTMLRFRAVVMFVKKLHDGQVLPRQRGALHAIRHLRGDSSEAKNDHRLQQFLQEMVDLGLVEFVGRWRAWDDVISQHQTK